MSLYQYRAWLMLWGLCPTYTIYFGLQMVGGSLLTTTLMRLIVLAAAALIPALVALVGAAVRGRPSEEEPVADERDVAIEAHATRAAYWLLMTGAVSVGMFMAFSQGGWKIVNSTLFSIVLAEILRNALILRGYRGRTLGLAH